MTVDDTEANQLSPLDQPVDVNNVMEANSPARNNISFDESNVLPNQTSHSRHFQDIRRQSITAAPGKDQFFFEIPRSMVGTRLRLSFTNP